MRGGVILGGGRSTRFGEGDKAVADLAGTPMLRRVADRVRPAVDELVVNCRADQVEPFRDALASYDGEVRFAEDPEPDLGPMAGIRNGLRETAAAYAFVVACDMPFVEPALASLLFERAAGRDAAVARLEDGWFQTTQAVYRADAMAAACDAALSAGDRRIVEALFELDYAVVEESTVREHAPLSTFENVNTAEELADAAERFTR